ncbi:hypothetical protein [Leisingera sp. McT4-56]|uniref:hypothetical protein n=1 Tax=Leisingera sp. McT4-56 TaxID=2881255 RepID=UPI001CF8340E|nr:hypothetical protein [Leisingera sp. McT4-56]MCB4455835.1 hypothetical protein [Leisingera sp. McT4-56]
MAEKLKGGAVHRLFCHLAMMLALRQWGCRNVSRAKHRVNNADPESWRMLAVNLSGTGLAECLVRGWIGRLAESLADCAGRGWLKSLWLLAKLAVWLP